MPDFWSSLVERRGLKFYVIFLSFFGEPSSLVERRGLKWLGVQGVFQGLLVISRRKTWIEINSCGLILPLGAVVSRREMWIEITRAGPTVLTTFVVSHRETWIEIFCRLIPCPENTGRLS